MSSQESDSLTDSGSLSDNKWVSAVGDTLYLAQADEQGNVNGLLQMQLDGNNGAKSKGEIPFSQDSYSSAYFSVLEDGTVYAADADGFFRCDAGDTNWQKLLQGIDTGFLCRISGAGILWHCRTAVYTHGLEVRAGIK